MMPFGDVKLMLGAMLTGVVESSFVPVVGFHTDTVHKTIDC